MVGVWLPDGSGVAPGVVRAGNCCFRLEGFTQHNQRLCKASHMQLDLDSSCCFSPLTFLTSMERRELRKFRAEWVWSPTQWEHQTTSRPFLWCFVSLSSAPRLAQQPSLWLILQGLSRWTPSHEKAYARFVVWRRGFLTLTHFMLPLPTLSVCVCLIFSGFYPPVAHTPTCAHTDLHTCWLRFTAC